MIYMYDIIQNEKGIPSLQKIKEIDINSEKQFNAENTILLLKNQLYLNLFTSEHAVIVGYDLNNCITGIFCVGIGNEKHVELFAKNIIIFLLLSGSRYFCFYHNHPGNNCDPSEADINSSLKLKEIGELIDVELKGTYILTHSFWKDINDSEPIGEMYSNIKEK